MGYRSEVTIAFYLQGGKSDERFPALKLWFDENYPKHEATTEWEAEIEYGDDYVLVMYRDVKWYDGYAHPTAVKEAFIRFDESFDTEKSQASWELVRIGEEVNDIVVESSSCADYRIDVRRYTEFN